MEIEKIDTKAKRNFIEKLQSGKYTFAPGRQMKDSKTFTKLNNSQFYHCDQTGETLDREGIDNLSAEYDFCVEITGDLNAPPSGFQLLSITHSEASILDSLLIPK